MSVISEQRRPGTKEERITEKGSENDRCQDEELVGDGRRAETQGHPG